MNVYDRELTRIAGMEIVRSGLTGRTVLLSGATGMIGKCLIDLLMLRNDKVRDHTVCGCKGKTDEPVQVIALSRNEDRARELLGSYWGREDFRYVSCDVNQPIPELGAVDYVIHAASNTHPLQYSQDPIGTIAANVDGTKNMLEYGAGHGARRFCFVSSVEVYGENRGDVEQFDEAYLGYLDCNTLRAGYPESKRLGETLCNAYGEARGLAFIIARLSRVYGPTMLRSDSKALSQFIKKAAAREPIVLKSQGTQKYSYTFVTDAVSGILCALLSGQPGEAYNVADKESDLTLGELAELLAGIGGAGVTYEIPPESERRGYSTATKAMLDASKLEKIGWRPWVHMTEGLECTVECLRRDNR